LEIIFYEEKAAYEIRRGLRINFHQGSSCMGETKWDE